VRVQVPPSAPDIPDDFRDFLLIFNLYGNSYDLGVFCTSYHTSWPFVR